MSEFTPSPPQADHGRDAVAARRDRLPGRAEEGGARIAPSAGWRLTWLRWLALALLVFGTPLSPQLLAACVSLVAALDDGCDGGCRGGRAESGHVDDEGDDCCAGPCLSCICCPHPNLVASAPFSLPALPASEGRMGLLPDQLCSSGYVSPPFRPPVA